MNRKLQTLHESVFKPKQRDACCHAASLSALRTQFLFCERLQCIGGRSTVPDGNKSHSRTVRQSPPRCKALKGMLVLID
eukprot:10953949-Lingulodinium_polyedra.AAC.1